ncbi:hypothetical protein BJ085DRAFT_32510 [Dimargaris cristalligena]|uniref:Uncharacterized protein n=1 Tax=Dimargaris cristalligena TaxID=215637 RepID=A0A4P9ZLX6_9FUNG|nr:hypothetical protein BJ085DRAFT_32510 [Dimargaris cristalligena]|eukprot:RKP33612.1 hypothetical protein BJ085DRAFT_32510 [Dimargaris cristalligena]
MRQPLYDYTSGSNQPLDQSVNQGIPLVSQPFESMHNVQQRHGSDSNDVQQFSSVDSRETYPFDSESEASPTFIMSERRIWELTEAESPEKANSLGNQYPNLIDSAPGIDLTTRHLVNNEVAGNDEPLMAPPLNAYSDEQLEALELVPESGNHNPIHNESSGGGPDNLDINNNRNSSDGSINLNTVDKEDSSEVYDTPNSLDSGNSRNGSQTHSSEPSLTSDSNEESLLHMTAINNFEDTQIPQVASSSSSSGMSVRTIEPTNQHEDTHANPAEDITEYNYTPKRRPLTTSRWGYGLPGVLSRWRQPTPSSGSDTASATTLNATSATTTTTTQPQDLSWWGTINGARNLLPFNRPQ